MTGRVRRLLPSLAALAYPTVVWAGPALHPAFLMLALTVPALAVVVFHRTPPAYPRARAIALLAAGAPALYSWLGGLLDFQRSIPLHGLGMWCIVWGLATAITAIEREGATGVRTSSPRLAFAHGLTATLIVAFAGAHVANHLVGLWGGDLHIAVMNVLRVVYRQPFIEATLLACVAFQFASGVGLLRHRVRVSGTAVDSLQACAGAYLACFFASHLTAALRARWMRGVDTNWVWLTTDSLLRDPWSARLAPYYFLAVVAVGVHAGAGLRHVVGAHGHTELADRLFTAVGVAAVVVAALVMTGLFRA